ncbi:hypothetical protein AB3M93_05890 [Novosphingobium panipatense]|jgi:tetratricopeptide (TPR) repeat protein|uniref:hypothetical protein n=1 Tax=Novosphingobium TaxID=165696 RepID=UPI000CDA7F78|nr:hypothetical protein [Novosphingobium sp. HII-3]
MKFKAFLGLLAVTLPVQPAQAAWLEASSDHFVIYANDTTKNVTRFAEQLERYHAGVALVFNTDTARPSPSNRVTVYVVKNEREVRKLHGGKDDQVAGFYVPAAGGSLAIVPAVEAASGAVTWSMVVLLHEYAHHFMISSSAMPMPRWVGEGAAEFFASAKFEMDGSLWMGRPAVHRAGGLLLGKDVQVAELLDPEATAKLRLSQMDGFYGKSWLLYHYLTFNEARRGQFSRYLALLGEGKSQTVAATEAFGDFAALEKELDRYLVQRRLSALKIDAGKLKIGPVALRALSAGEGAMMNVRVRSKRGVSEEEAMAVLAEARAIAALHPDDPAVLSALAECEYDAGNDGEAVTAADAALKRDPRQVNAYLQKGYALLRIAADLDGDAREAAYKVARAPFIALNRLENDHPLPLIYYYRGFVERGQKPSQLAIDGLVRAMQLAPFDLGLRAELGMALIALGRHGDAKAVLAAVAANPHGGSLSDYARKAIERMGKDPAWRGEPMDTKEDGTTEA